MVLGTAIISGVSIPVNSAAADVVGGSSSVFTGLKNLLVALIFLTALFAARQSRTLSSLPGRDWARLAVIGLVGGAIPFLLFFHGLFILAQAESGGALASFLHKSMFLLVALMATVFLKERLEKWLFITALLLLMGTFVLLSPALQGPALGYALVLGATAFWAAEITLSKATLRRLSPNVVVLGRMGFGALFILVYLALTGQIGSLATLGGVQWQWVLVTAVFLVAYVGTFYHGLKRIDATSATSLLVLGVAVSLALESLLRGLVPTPLQGVGILLILLGVMAGILRALRHREVVIREPVPTVA